MTERFSEHAPATRPMSIRGQHAERRRQVLKAVVDNPGRLGLSSLTTKTGLDFRDVEDAVDGLRLKGMIRSNGKALLSPTRDGIFLITGKEEIARIEELHMLLLSRGPQKTGVLAKRMSLSRSSASSALLTLLEQGLVERRKGPRNSAVWVWVGDTDTDTDTDTDPCEECYGTGMRTTSLSEPPYITDYSATLLGLETWRVGQLQYARSRTKACPHCADAATDADPVTETEETEEIDEAPLNVVQMPQQEPDDPDAELIRQTARAQIDSLTKSKAHLTVELAKVEACLVALRGLL